MKALLRSAIRRFARSSGLATSAQVRARSLELIYQNIFLNRNPGLSLYPLGSAANYSLLYLIDRIIEENIISRCLEFGIGQSTLLLSALRENKDFDLISVDHDQYWIDQMRGKVSHKLIHAPLRKTNFSGVTTEFYDMGFLTAEDRFDLVIVDGPPAFMTDKFARIGVLEVAKEHLMPDFVIVMDDAERVGEQTTIEVLRQTIADTGESFHECTTEAQKHQHVFCTDKFQQVSFY